MKLGIFLSVLMVAFLVACASGVFSNLLTDAATRLAYELKAEASKLKKSAQQEWEMEHLPIRSPEGIDGPYEVWLQAVEQGNNLSGSLSVGNVGGKRYGTSYHLRFVTVPKDLRIRKKKGEATYLTLRKTGVANDDNELRGSREVEVISIR